MNSYIVTVKAPKYLTTEQEILMGAKNIFDLARIIIKYSPRYAEFNIKVR